MGNLGRRALVLVFAALAMSAMAACGSDDDGGDSADSGGEGGAAKQGGSVTISQTSQPDYLDPALSYTVNGWEPQWLVYTPPITYKRAEGVEGTELIPGVAEELPEVSEDGKTVTFTMRKGLKYSDGTPVKASDFEHTIKRVLNLESGATGFFLVIEGAQEYIDAGKPDGDISGIETDDKTGEVTIKLTSEDGTILNVLAMNFAGHRPGRHAVQEPVRRSAPGRRSLQVHRVGAQPPVRDGEEHRASTSRASPRATSTRSRPRSSSRPSARPRT